LEKLHFQITFSTEFDVVQNLKVTTNPSYTAFKDGQTKSLSLKELHLSQNEFTGLH
jgi:hypothetical protein